MRDSKWIAVLGLVGWLPFAAACGGDDEGSGGSSAGSGGTGGATGGSGGTGGAAGATSGGTGGLGGGTGATGGAAGSGGAGGTGGAAGSGGTGGTGGGWSLRFFGTGQNDVDRVKIPIDAPAVPADVGSGDFTIELWLEALPGENAAGPCAPGNDNWITGNIILDRDVYGGGDYGDYGLSLFSDGLAFGVGKGSAGDGLCGATNVANGAWHHVAVTRVAATGQVRLWVDGALDAEMTGPTGDISYRDGRATSWPSSDPFLVIGAEKHDAGSSYPSFAGWVDELRLSTVVRYSGTFTPPGQHAPDAETAALYHFDEGSGTALGDTSGASGGPSNGQLQVGGPSNGPLWSADVPF